MKILIYSSVFWPSIGGIETITETLAENIQKLGHECCILTKTKSNHEKKSSYKIYRNLSSLQTYKLVKEVDIIHSNGASVAMYPYAKLARKPFIWTHNGYQVSCIDGLGWYNDQPAPMEIQGSVLFYLKEKGVFFTTKEIIKLLIRRYVAKNVDLNIAATNWIAKRQPLRNQIVAYTPYPINKFKINNSNPSKYDFLYVGRLVSEKGVNILLNAFYTLLKSSDKWSGKTLAIVGDGPKREHLEKQVKELGLKNNIFFLGFKMNTDLIKIITISKIAIIPSTWEEPMGGVTLELLAAGKTLIVSENGGHAECVRNAALTFPNGNEIKLYECMKNLLENKELSNQLLNYREDILDKFDECNLTEKYLDIYKSVIETFYK